MPSPFDPEPLEQFPFARQPQGAFPWMANASGVGATLEERVCALGRDSPIHLVRRPKINAIVPWTEHYGIVVGGMRKRRLPRHDGTPIFDPDPTAIVVDLQFGVGLRCVSIDQFRAGNDTWLAHTVPPAELPAAHDRLRSLIASRPTWKVLMNCQHFATQVAFGKPTSQVEQAMAKAFVGWLAYKVVSS